MYVCLSLSLSIIYIYIYIYIYAYACAGLLGHLLVTVTEFRDEALEARDLPRVLH